MNFLRKTAVFCGNRQSHAGASTHDIRRKASCESWASVQPAPARLQSKEERTFVGIAGFGILDFGTLGFGISAYNHRFFAGPETEEFRHGGVKICVSPEFHSSELPSQKSGGNPHQRGEFFPTSVTVFNVMSFY